MPTRHPFPTVVASTIGFAQVFHPSTDGRGNLKPFVLSIPIVKNKFPAYYNATKKILSDTIRQVQKDYQDRYGTAFKETPLE